MEAHCGQLGRSSQSTVTILLLLYLIGDTSTRCQALTSCKKTRCLLLVTTWSCPEPGLLVRGTYFWQSRDTAILAEASDC